MQHLNDLFVLLNRGCLGVDRLRLNGRQVIGALQAHA
jgi:hypothetical protein